MVWRRTAILLAVALCALATPAAAKSSVELRYSRSQVFSSALRYLRVDLGLDVVERDPDAAYLLFHFPGSTEQDLRVGSFEIIKTPQGVRLHVQMAKAPNYRESMLRDGLVRKVRNDYGPAADDKKEAPPEPPKDKAGPAEKGADDGKS